MSEQAGQPAPGPGRRRRRLLLGLGGLGVLLAGAYAVAVLLVGDTLPRGTSVAGVPVGGLTRTEAAERLEDRLADRADQPVAVTVDGSRERLDPAEAGLSLDTEASVAQVAGGSRWSPVGLVRRLAGGDEHAAVAAVDRDRLAQALDALDVGREPRDGAVRLTRQGVRVTEPRAGVGVDVDGAADALASYLDSEGPVTVPTTEEQPAIDADDVAQARDDFADPALSGPVTIRFGEAAVELTPRQFAPALRLVADDGALQPQLRPGKVHTLLDGLVAQEGQEPVDATVRLVRGEPRVVPAKPGVSYDRAAVDDAFLDLVTQPEGERELGVEAAVAEPEVSTEDAEAWGISEKVSSFTTSFPYAEYRNVNIGRAAELVNGTVVPPGEDFSLNETVGERTAENGFTEGFVISDGIFKEDLGGGVSQMATTTFNAGFFAGMTDVEHKPHSFYIDRYPVGREATVAWPTVDMRWGNDTPYGVLIHAHLTPSTPSSPGEITVDLYSTEYWDITTETSDRYAFTSPATRVLDTPDCYANTGYGGFDVDVFRYWRRAGSDALERTEKMHTTYTPSDTVVCRPPGSLSDGGESRGEGDDA